MADPFGFNTGIHFIDPSQFLPFSKLTPTIIAEPVSANTSAAAAFFTTGLAGMGLADTTNWSSGVKKTIATLSSSKGGIVAAYIGPTAGGVETHTVEFTLDSRAPITVTITPGASGKRLCLFATAPTTLNATTAVSAGGNESELSGNAIFGDMSNGATVQNYLPPWSWLTTNQTPCLIFKSTCTIKATHSASITNSTATAYSGVMFRYFPTV